ncbi:hypothetical protein E0H53_09555 [Rhizobium leguminosarum bv. viciae]|uniref:hypothetical protein n=1 Tax=Rhizobium leguminosarum TaxID=384 RepID=UPI0010389E0B|nr:hypothetical protein [Rhizobium leguminosarum]TBZ90008.1 hypothetical protein E0H53_09555 [Rhizobium leguminosarum bv. viciae]
MGDTEAAAEKIEVQSAATISLKEFLEGTHPSVLKEVSDLWDIHVNSSAYKRKLITLPDLRLHCAKCEGFRTFRCSSNQFLDMDTTVTEFNSRYKCGDCHEQTKLFSLYVKFGQRPAGEVYKYGELPPFGIPVPNKVLRLFGKDANLFQKGRQCENLGYGVAAFSYYRRVVENHKNDIFEEIIKVCRTVNAPTAIIGELQKAKKEIAFTKAIEAIKSALPQGLLTNGHNPLLALHGALSAGLHDESDEECLAAAQAVRLVLTDLVEKIATLKQDNRELNEAMQLLLKKKS